LGFRISMYIARPVPLPGRPTGKANVNVTPKELVASAIALGDEVSSVATSPCENGEKGRLNAEELSSFVSIPAPLRVAPDGSGKNIVSDWPAGTAEVIWNEYPI
jgi:hypothetical protein